MRWAVAAAALSMAACHETQPTAENQAVASENPTAETSANTAAAKTGQLAKLPSADAALRFVGTWAEKQSECASKPWRFTADALTVGGGPQCRFYKVSKAPGGYNLAASCPTKKPVHTDLIRLRFAESAQAMLVESNAIPPTGLIYCGAE
jgi:hypothetical protein